jgi:hypothetical protein
LYQLVANRTAAEGQILPVIRRAMLLAKMVLLRSLRDTRSGAVLNQVSE